MNDGQLKLDLSSKKKPIVIPDQLIDNTFKSQAESDYEKKKREQRKAILDQLNRVIS